MKQAILTATILLVAYASFAQPISSSFHLTSPPNGDSLSVQNTMTQEALSVIMSVVGLQQTFELKEANVLNIEASISHGKRCILYNPQFIDWINKVTRSRWASIALLAHEIGHHLNGHTLKKGGSKPELELEADEFAGFILRRLGATLEESQEVMKYIAKPETSATHPCRSSRMLAIQNGWNRGTDSAPTGALARATTAPN